MLKQQTCKTKLDIPQFILVLNGPSTAGKTSVGEIFFKKYNNIFFASRDKIKNMISGYQDNPKKFLDLSHKMQLSLIDVAINNGLSVVLDQGTISPSGEQSIGDLVEFELEKISKIYNISIFEFNIEAGFDILKKRFLDRVEKAKRENTEISLTDLDEFERRFNLYMKQKKENRTFLSDEFTAMDIFNRILSLLMN